MSAGNGEPPIPFDQAKIIGTEELPIPNAANCSANFAAGRAPELVLCAAAIGILYQLERLANSFAGELEGPDLTEHATAPDAD